MSDPALPSNLWEEEGADHDFFLKYRRRAKSTSKPSSLDPASSVPTSLDDPDAPLPEIDLEDPEADISDLPLDDFDEMGTWDVFTPRPRTRRTGSSALHVQSDLASAVFRAGGHDIGMVLGVEAEGGESDGEEENEGEDGDFALRFRTIRPMGTSEGKGADVRARLLGLPGSAAAAAAAPAAASPPSPTKTEAEPDDSPVVVPIPALVPHRRGSRGKRGKPKKKRGSFLGGISSQDRDSLPSSQSGSGRRTALDARRLTPRGSMMPRRRKVETTISPEMLLLLPKGFDATPLAAQGYEIHVFADMGDVDGLNHLLSDGADPNMLDRDNRTALHYAARSGHFAVVERLLGCRELKVEVLDRWGYTPLQIAIKLERIECIRSLLAFGFARLGEASAGQKVPPPVELAKQSSNSEVIKCFIDHEDVCARFLAAIRRPEISRSQLAHFIVQHKPDVSYVSTNGESAVSLCASFPDRARHLQLLLDNHAHVTEKCVRDALPEYRNLLENALRRQKREYVILELLSSEKIFVDDLSLTLGIWGNQEARIRRLMKPSRIPERLVFGVFEVLQKLRSTHLSVIRRFQAASHTSTSFRTRTDWCDAEEFLQCLSELIDKESHLRYIRRFNRMDSMMKSTQSLAALSRWFTAQALRIPYPKVQLMMSMFGASRVRIVKYKDLCSRIARYSDVVADRALKSLATAVTDQMNQILVEMDVVVGELLDRKKQRSIFRIWKSRYKIPAEIIPTMRSNALGEEPRYLSHCEKVACWNLGAGGKRTITQKDLFVFSDSIWIGSPEVKTVGGCFFHDTRSVFVFSGKFLGFSIQTPLIILTKTEDTFRVTIYKDSEKITDLHFLFPMARLWHRTLKEFFLSPERSVTFANKVLILSRFDEVDQVRKFLDLPKMMSARDVLTRQLDRLTRQIMELDARREAVDDRVDSLPSELAVDPVESEVGHGHESPMILIHGKLKTEDE